MAKARKTFLSESDIQKYEHMEEGLLVAAFADGLAVVQLLRSYRIAANVAHSAWKLVEEMKTRGEPSMETWDELEARLKMFAPNAAQFRASRLLLEYECRVLEELYDHLSAWIDGGSTFVLMEQLFARIEKKRQELSTA